MKKGGRKTQFDNLKERYIWYTSLFLVLAFAVIGITTETLGR